MKEEEEDREKKRKKIINERAKAYRNGLVSMAKDISKANGKEEGNERK